MPVEGPLPTLGNSQPPFVFDQNVDIQFTRNRQGPPCPRTLLQMCTSSDIITCLDMG